MRSTHTHKWRLTLWGELIAHRRGRRPEMMTRGTSKREAVLQLMHCLYPPGWETSSGPAWGAGDAGDTEHSPTQLPDAPCDAHTHQGANGGVQCPTRWPSRLPGECLQLVCTDHWLTTTIGWVPIQVQSTDWLITSRQHTQCIYTNARTAWVSKYMCTEKTIMCLWCENRLLVIMLN